MDGGNLLYFSVSLPYQFITNMVCPRQTNVILSEGSVVEIAKGAVEGEGS